jgi:hypothetical protein
MLYEEFFYAMRISNSNYYMHISCRNRGTERNFSPYMSNIFMEYAQGYYIHEENIIGLHVSMGNVETNSNERRDRQESVTMRSLNREVQSYRVDNERIIKAQEEIL